MPYRRVTHTEPCPICRKPNWCLVSEDGKKAICPRTSQGAERYLDNAGYLHTIALSGAQAQPRDCYERQGAALKRPTLDAARLAGQYCAEMSRVRLERFAAELRVFSSALNQLCIGWCQDHESYTFPMRDGNFDIIGIRTRSAVGGKHRAIAGSRAGLFLPATFKRGTIYICEGPSDTAAMISLGFAAIGRPSCMGSHEQIRTFLRRYHTRDLCVVADNDGPGRDGAVSLCEDLGRGRIMNPPERVKDIRDRAAEVLEIMEALCEGDEANASLKDYRK